MLKKASIILAPMLEITNLSVKSEDKLILSSVNLKVESGTVHALMGPNGSGKSTLAQTLAGSPAFTVTAGSIVFKGEDLLTKSPEQRANLGIFLSFQHPLEIPGLNVASFLRMIYNRRVGQNTLPVKFKPILEEKMTLAHMAPEFAQRYLNDGFSGGEKKRMEILQMLVLEPDLVILDEVDSGLDVDALKDIAKAVMYLKEKKPQTAILLITHYARILNLIKPDLVHIMQKGTITTSGDSSLVHTIETSGFNNGK